MVGRGSVRAAARCTRAVSSLRGRKTSEELRPCILTEIQRQTISGNGQHRYSAIRGEMIHLERKGLRDQSSLQRSLLKKDLLDDFTINTSHTSFEKAARVIANLMIDN